MDRSPGGFFGLLLLTPLASTQGDLRSQAHRITAPLRHAGVYHVATGTWTRGASMESLVGPDVVYDNTCSTGYFSGQQTWERWQHRSRLPSPTGPTAMSLFYGPPRKDMAPGCRTSYALNGFQIGYCSSRSSGPLTYRYEFASSYLYCGVAEMVADYAFVITGLPAGTATGAQRCWIVDVDTSATSPPFVLLADGDGVYLGPPNAEQFGFALGPVGQQTYLDATGPIIAGNYTWTGGPSVGVLTPCTGTDGTIWDAPANLSEEGTGMSSNDYFRISPVKWGPYCYYFGGTLHSDFFLQLFSDTGCTGSGPLASYCFPGNSGVLPCPCGNPPSALGRGCNNFGAVSGGAELTATGAPSLAGDTMVFTSAGENASALTIILQGTSVIPLGIEFGAGVRCVGGSLKRLYTGSASGGSITRPGTSDPSVSARSAQLGDPIAAGTERFYMAYYRDPAAAGPCDGEGNTFNASQSGGLTWEP